MKIAQKSKQNPTIKINYGILKNLRLDTPSKATTRPTKAILREAFFNSIRAHLQGCVFAECFAGSGSMGLEALSNGAGSAVFCELDSQSFGVLQANIARAQKLANNELKIHALNADFFHAWGDLEHIFERADSEIILYLDPPFSIRAGMQNMYEKCFDFAKNLQSQRVKLLAFELMSECESVPNLGIYELVKTKNCGKSKICLYWQK